MGAGAFFGGVLGLAALEVVVSTPRSANLVGGVGQGLDAFVRRIVDPRIGLIPNLHDNGSSSSAATSPTPSGQASAPPPTPLPTRPAAPGRSRTARSGKSTDPSAGRPPLLAPPIGTKEAS